ncbi:hypothetical protein M0R72_01790 [Candidatus Pacearchaeota archaeon]|jgi:hypothetical protein|nr:hypothetical protein [Candidatus Pacearchaeota archaeon]
MTITLYTASYWEPEVHGPGRKIGISPSKPKNLQEECGYDCSICHEFLSPENVYWDYHKAKKAADGDDVLMKKAGDDFVIGYKNRLQDFKTTLENESKQTGQSIQTLIGFEDGDTLLSWERGGHTSFREHAAAFLRELGYEVIER